MTVLAWAMGAPAERVLQFERLALIATFVASATDFHFCRFVAVGLSCSPTGTR
jgi:hypothetical protein